MIWLLISVVLLIVLIFFRIDILLVAPIVSVFLCLVSGLDVVDTLAEGFMPAFATFAKNNCDVTRSVSKMTEIERRGGKRWDKPKKAEKSRDCGGGKF